MITHRARFAVVLAALATFVVPARAEQPPGARITPTEVDSWAYQLQNVKPSSISKDGFDVLVVDYARDGTDASALTRADVDRLRRREGDKDRIVLAYLSIGEAERYRYYWRDNWLSESEKKSVRQKPRGYSGAPSGPAMAGPPLARLSKSAPTWLSKENPSWRGNFLVAYWKPEWHSIIYGDHNSYVERILAAGFDGVYLDKIDSHEDWQPTRPTAEREMVAFVQAIATHARAKKAGFLIVPQNGEELLKFPDYVASIDAIAKEDLLFGGGERRDGEANPEPEVANAKALLDKAAAAGRPVLAVEYLVDPLQVEAADRRLVTYGYIPHFATRSLDTTPTPRPVTASSSRTRSPVPKAIQARGSTAARLNRTNPTDETQSGLVPNVSTN